MQTNLLNKRNFVRRFHSGNKVWYDFERQMVGILTLTTRSVGLFDLGSWEENWSGSLGLSMADKYKADDDQDMEMQTTAAAAVTENG